MGSPEILGSGRVWSNNFSRTCNRLSRYLKEKGSFGNFDLVFNPPPNMESKETMNLFPVMMDKDGQKNQIHENSCVLSVGKHEVPQMTIFYGGRIVVFDDLSADKAKEIVTLAGKLSAGAPRAAAAAQERDGPLLQPPPLDSDPPIARKNTLSRFLEKRKDRVTANAPYTAVKPPPVKGEGSWLGLMPMQIPRN